MLIVLDDPSVRVKYQHLKLITFICPVSMIWYVKCSYAMYLLYVFNCWCFRMDTCIYNIGQVTEPWKMCYTIYDVEQVTEPWKMCYLIKWKMCYLIWYSELLNHETCYLIYDIVSHWTMKNMVSHIWCNESLNHKRFVIPFM